MQAPDPSALTGTARATGLVTTTSENVRDAHLVATGQLVHRHVESLEEHVTRSHERLVRREFDDPVLPWIALDEALRQSLTFRFLFLVEPSALARAKRGHRFREQLLPVRANSLRVDAPDGDDPEAPAAGWVVKKVLVVRRADDDTAAAHGGGHSTEWRAVLVLRAREKRLHARHRVSPHDVLELGPLVDPRAAKLHERVLVERHLGVGKPVAAEHAKERALACSLRALKDERGVHLAPGGERTSDQAQEPSPKQQGGELGFPVAIGTDPKYVERDAVEPARAIPREPAEEFA